VVVFQYDGKEFTGVVVFTEAHTSETRCVCDQATLF